MLKWLLAIKDLIRGAIPSIMEEARRGAEKPKSGKSGQRILPKDSKNLPD